MGSRASCAQPSRSHLTSGPSGSLLVSSTQWDAWAPQATNDMKVGLILEGNPKGPDQQVCELLARRIREDLFIETVTMGNKPSLISGCGDAAAGLLASGCERVLVIWDLYPPWGQRN